MSPQSVLRYPTPPCASAAAAASRHVVRALVMRPRMLDQLEVPGATQNGTPSPASAAQRSSNGCQSS